MHFSLQFHVIFDDQCTLVGTSNKPQHFTRLCTTHSVSIGKDTPVTHRSLIKKLYYIVNNRRLDISMAAHQCSQFVWTQKPFMNYRWNMSYNIHTLKISRHGYDSSNHGNVHRLRLHRNVEEKHAHFCSGILYCTGFVIMFRSCPITWASKLQTGITLSTSKSECITLRTRTRERFPLH